MQGKKKKFTKPVLTALIRRKDRQIEVLQVCKAGDLAGGGNPTAFWKTCMRIPDGQVCSWCGVGSPS
ncbi:MAG: hypothetical protein PHT31_05240 [Candidatus Omnitrophica bacterium]|nr:hypothetical protein [Candidatus Omnitrophota bacterium]